MLRKKFLQLLVVALIGANWVSANHKSLSKNEGPYETQIGANGVLDLIAQLKKVGDTKSLFVYELNVSAKDMTILLNAIEQVAPSIERLRLNIIVESAYGFVPGIHQAIDSFQESWQKKNRKPENLICKKYWDVSGD